MEIEAKYAILDPQTFNLLQRLQCLGPYPLVDSKQRSFRDTYLDTPDGRLLRAGYACRWRVTDTIQRITVKGLAQGLATAHQREEFEALFHDVDPTRPAGWGNTPPHDLVMRLIGDLSLSPLLALRQTRMTRLLLNPQGDPLAELALDRFIVEGDPSQRASLELEIELIGSADVSQLTPIQQALSQIDGLSWQPTSKFERAVFIAIPQSPTARTLGLWGIEPNQPTAEAYRRAMRPLFLQMLITEPNAYVGEGDDAQTWLEAIQSLRVLLVNVSAQFEDRLEPTTGKTLERAVREAETLRATEIFKEMECNPAESSVRASDLVELHRVWEIAYRHHHENLQGFLTGPAYAKLKQSVWTWLNQPAKGLPHAPQFHTDLAHWLADEITHCTAEGETFMASSQPAPTGCRPLLHTVRRLHHMLAAFHEVLDDEIPFPTLSHYLTELETSLAALDSIAANLPHLQALHEYGTWEPPSRQSDILSHQVLQRDIWARLLRSYTSCYQALYSATRDLWYACWHNGARPLLQRQQRVLMRSVWSRHRTDVPNEADPRRNKTMTQKPTYVILMGPPASGKGTQAERLQQILDLPHVASGDLFRYNLKNQTELGLKAKVYMDKGELVPDDITIAMVLDRLSRPDCARGALLDGFPRTLAQAAALDRALEEQGAAIDLVLNLQVPEEELISRITGRRVCRDCGATYHIKYNPPKVAGVCDKCGGELYQRDDDTEETARRRLTVYLEQTQPLIEYYNRKGVLVHIDGNRPIDEVTEALKDAVEKVLG